MPVPTSASQDTACGQRKHPRRPSDLALLLIDRSAESEHAPDRLNDEHAVKHRTEEMPQPDQPALGAAALARDALDPQSPRPVATPRKPPGRPRAVPAAHRRAECPRLRQRAGRSVRLLPPHGREQCKESERQIKHAFGDVPGMAGPAFPSRQRPCRVRSYASASLELGAHRIEDDFLEPLAPGSALPVRERIRRR